ARFGLIDMRTQGEVLSALRSDTPLQLPQAMGPTRAAQHPQKAVCGSAVRDGPEFGRIAPAAEGRRRGSNGFGWSAAQAVRRRRPSRPAAPRPSRPRDDGSGTAAVAAATISGWVRAVLYTRTSSIEPRNSSVAFACPNRANTSLVLAAKLPPVFVSTRLPFR